MAVGESNSQDMPDAFDVVWQSTRIYTPLLIHSVLILDAVIIVVVVHGFIVTTAAFAVARAPALARVTAALVVVLLLGGFVSGGLPHISCAPCGKPCW